MCAPPHIVIGIGNLFFAAALFAVPRIDSISPSQGPITGGTEVIVTGAGFSGATVRIDSTIFTPLSLTDTSIRLRMPAHDNGYSVINVRSGTSNAYAEFLFVPPRLQDLPTGYITTVAGVGHYVRDFGPALNATIWPAGGLAFDANGNLYIAEPNNNKISRLRPNGTIERVTAPGDLGSPAGDGKLAVDANVVFPLSVAVDPTGNVYAPDAHNLIRKIDAQTGLISSIAGTGEFGTASGDSGLATQARLGGPRHVAADASDVFFIDFSDGIYALSRAQRIRRVHLADGRISTFAGTGIPGFSGDGGPATQAQFNVGDADRGHLVLDPAGNLYLADTANFRIRRIDRASGIITTFYQLGRDATDPDNIGDARSLAFDRAGNLYVGGAGRILKISPAGALVKSWGGAGYAIPPEGAPASAGFGLVTGLAIDTSGNIFLADGLRVRRIDVATDKIFSAAGMGPAIIGETGPAIATVTGPFALAVDRDGNVLLGDNTTRLRRIDRNGNISTIAGNGSFVGKPAPTAATNYVLAPASVSVDANGEIELALQSVIGHIDHAGIIREIVGRGGLASYTGDGGPATTATLCQAWDCTRDAQGNLLIADTNNNRVRRVDAQTGIITTIVGNGGPVNGYEQFGIGRSSGDGGLAIDAAINTPYGLAVDAAGNLFVGEATAIRKVDPAGRISTFAPIGPGKIILDAAGNLYGSVNAGVFRLDPAGNRTWVAGSSASATDSGFSGDGGPASQAKVRIGKQSAGLAIDDDGNLYFCDDNRVRAVRGATPAGPQRFPALPARLSNVSVRTAMVENQTLIVGLTTSGGARNVLLRAAGPALSSVGVANPMADPRLDLFNGASALLRSNDNWDASLAATFTSVGAFAFPNSSKDAALVHSLDGGYTAQARGTGAGIVLVEAYDLGSANSPRLTNASVRNLVGTGANILIAGFNVAGTGTKPLLIRAVGPKLAAFGVGGFLADPKLELYDSKNKKLDENDNWSATLAPIFTSVGAFPLDANSKDAALYTVLAPGSYTVQVKSADGGTGEALVEVYEVP